MENKISTTIQSTPSTICKADISNKLTAYESEIVKAKISLPTVSRMSVPKLTEVITSALKNAYLIKGVGVPSTESLLFTIKELCNIFIVKYAGYNEFDIMEALRQGALGNLKEIGDLNNVSAEICVQWVARYNNQIRKNAIFEQIEYEKKKAKEFDESQFNYGRRDYLYKICQLYLDFNFSEYPLKSKALFYKTLKEFNFIDLDKEKQDFIWVESERILKTIQTDENLFIICDRIDVARGMALREQFLKWRKEEKILYVSNLELILT